MKTYRIEEEPAGPGAAEASSCPGCSADAMKQFYSFSGAPVHSVLLMRSKEEAVSYPKGDIRLGFCEKCGFISNTAYDPALQHYSDRCEESQGFSATYNAFARKLASSLIEKHGLRGKRIIEIGCGKGEFLALLCEMGGNSGTGFDPAYVRGRLKTKAKVEFVEDFYSEKYSGIKAEFVVCKMTLEHIGRTGQFLSTLRNTLGDSPETTVFFQVPDVTRVLRELAFWDVYYEHCSYFSPGSLSRLFRTKGFEVTDISVDYGAQYILLEARPCAQPNESLHMATDTGQLRKNVRYFSENVSQKISLWRHKLREFSKTGYRTVLWGSGSKAVAFLTTMGITDEIKYLVDINPYRKGTYAAGTGHEIVSPDFLIDYCPDAVIAMNPVYRDEIERDIKEMGLSAEVLTV